MPADENTRSWHESGDSFVSRSSWHSSERGISQLANPPPSVESTRSGSRPGASPLASVGSPTTPAQSFSSLPPASPISIAQSQLDEQDRQWDEIRRNRSLPRRPLSIASSASTIRPAIPVALPPEIDDALDELARRAEELDERERRLDDDEFRVRENADAQARWLAEETDRLDEEEGQLRQAAEDEATRVYNNLAPGRRRSASDVSDITAGRGARERQSRLFQHPANDRPAEHHRRPLPPPEPIDLPSPVHDRGGRRPPGESDRRPPLDFDRRTASLSLPYPEPISYPRMGSTRPAATGARAPITQPFVPRPSRSAIDAAYADYGSYSARSRPGLFGSWFPRRSGRSYGVRCFSTSRRVGKRLTLSLMRPPFGRSTRRRQATFRLATAAAQAGSEATRRPGRSGDGMQACVRFVIHDESRPNLTFCYISSSSACERPPLLQLPG
jgi:hypothetical protein